MGYYDPAAYDGSYAYGSYMPPGFGGDPGYTLDPISGSYYGYASYDPGSYGSYAYGSSVPPGFGGDYGYTLDPIYGSYYGSVS